MADGHGGHRTPAHPAATSGPGKYSRRTDGKQPIRNLSDPSYGGGKEFREIQQGAQMAASGEKVAHGADIPALPPPTGLGAPSQSQDPVTAGADAGEGPGMDALGLPAAGDEAEELRQRFGQWIPVLVRMADDPLSSPELKAQVRYVLSMI